MVTTTREDQSRTQRKNIIINGNLDIWQRGVNFPGLSGSGESYTADRWLLTFVNSGTWTVTRDTSVPVGVNVSFSLKATVTVADGSVGVGDYTTLHYRIEGYNFFPLYQRSFTFTFWVKSNITGIYNFSVRNSVPDRSYVTPFTINVADVWEFKTITVTATPSGGTWNFTNNVGARIDITLVAGATFQTTPNTWQTGNFISSAGQVNLAGTIGNYIQITQVQLERGATPSLIEARPFSEELALCQRYYEKSYNIDVNPGTITPAGRMSGEADGVLQSNMHRAFATVKRITPAITWYNPLTGAISSLDADGLPESINGTSGAGTGATGVPTTTNFLAATTDINVHFTADAEL